VYDPNIIKVEANEVPAVHADRSLNQGRKWGKLFEQIDSLPYGDWVKVDMDDADFSRRLRNTIHSTVNHRRKIGRCDYRIKTRLQGTSIFLCKLAYTPKAEVPVVTEAPATE